MNKIIITKGALANQEAYILGPNLFGGFDVAQVGGIISIDPTTGTVYAISSLVLFESEFRRI
jgi:hypothetical protein